MHTQKYIKSKLVVSRYDRFSVAGIRNVKEKKGQEFAKLDRAGIVGMTEENARFPRVDGFEGLNAARARRGIGNARILPPLPPSIDPEFLNGLIERRPFSPRCYSGWRRSGTVGTRGRTISRDPIKASNHHWKIIKRDRGSLVLFQRGNLCEAFLCLPCSINTIIEIRGQR